jgi:methylthioribose-1-phosphate isomerase
MQEFDSLSIKFQNGKLSIIDQVKLPAVEEWVECNHPDEMVHLIKGLHVRGAPLIGVAAAMALAVWVEKESPTEADIRSASERLRASRPTAVNLMWALDKLVVENDDLSPGTLSEIAFKIFDDDRKMCRSMGENGAALISEGENIIHHCNTGGLATAGIGTALGVIQVAHEQGKNIHVYVDETRPLLQGGRLTTWELEKLGVPYTLICDNMAAALMRDGKIQRALVGSDRIANNGDFANKTGTYSLAVNCHYHDIPIHPVAPLSTVDFKAESISDIPIEMRNADEVRGVKGSFGECIWSPVDSPVYNPSFDVPPATLMESLVLDAGVIDKSHFTSGKTVSDWLSENT